MTNQHPITPPLELVHQWADMLSHRSDHAVFSFAAQWGADRELDACVELIRDNDGYDASLGLRATRRPKPPTLKEQAHNELDAVYAKGNIDDTTYKIIRRALEALPDELEGLK